MSTPLNQPYDAHIIEYILLEAKFELLSKVFTTPVKVYFVDIRGRDDPEKYEWEHSGLDKEEIRAGLESLLSERQCVGTPHVVVAFPHVTSIYRFGHPMIRDERETNIYKVGTYTTQSLEKLSITSDDGSIEIACPAEACIIGKEMEFWANALNVETYLRAQLMPGQLIRVRGPNKLRQSLTETPS